MARVVFKAVRPPVVLKAPPLASTRGAAFTLPSPKDGGSRPEASKPEEPTPSTSQPSLQVSEQSGRASDTDSSKAEITSEEVLPPQSLKVRLPLGLLKHSHETTVSGSKNGAMPSKVQKEPEAEESKNACSTGPSEVDLSKAQFELYQKDRPEVQDIWARILELDDRDKVTQKVLDSSLTFQLRWAADESHSPAIIGDHWINHLESEGRIA